MADVFWHSGSSLFLFPLLLDLPLFSMVLGVIPADVKLGNGKVIPGVSVYIGPSLTPGRMYPLVYAGSGGGDGGINSRAAKGEVLKKAGGIGMILANGVFDGEGLVADCHVLPATAVGAANGDEIRRYIDSSSKTKSQATATIVFKGTRLGVKPAPVLIFQKKKKIRLKRK
ncbi:hypothetical protein COLO4_28909 [Corchorus olitorius]|uniref:PA domain-containing protein n=1 Tax=Corchorus olitorius TaxID=93759 RepID=A0A1R3HHQ2_9ROSI|nr:hypothetical protein COLO4_28909 [Corchorus olitorius]